MRRTLLAVGVSLVFTGQGGAQNGDWTPLGPWELVERLDDVQVVKVLRAGDLTPALFPPKPSWQPDFGGDFFPASDVLLYRRMPASSGQQQYYAYESDYVVLDDANIRRQYDTTGQGRFRVSRVEIAVYFPFAGIYQIQGFWTGSDDDLPPYPTSDPPNTFLRSNQGPHTLFVPQAGVWRLATNTDPQNEVFTVQCGVLDESLDPQRRFNCYVGIAVEPPGAWVCGALPGTDLNMDYFIEHNGSVYEAYQLQGGVPATFALQLGGAAAPQGTQLQGTITINGYTGSYAGKQATIKVKQGFTINTYTTTLAANGSYSLRVNETGNAEVLAQLTPGLAKKVSLNLNGTVTQNFALTNGDVNGDNVVDDADLLTVLFNFGGNNAASDVNGDNVVDDADLLIVLFNFGSTGDGL
jgi:hypothetical protein